MRLRPVLLVSILWAGATALAQDVGKEQPEDVQRMVREGLVEALEARFHGGRTPDEKELIAQSCVSRARRAKTDEEQKRSFEKADEKYRAWIEALELATRGAGSLADNVRLAAGRVKYGNMILSVQAGPELDELEISAGQRGDRALAGKLLAAARGQYEQAAKDIAALADLSRENEETLLAAGALETLQQTRLDLLLNLGWTHYYCGVLEQKDELIKHDHLAVAERKFQELVNFGQPGQIRYTCYLALAMSQREQGRLADAEQNFKYALGEDIAPLTAAQVRYEWARVQFRQNKFDEARTMLRPLTEKDPQNLDAADRPLRFYVNLAHIWDANSFLLEAEVIRRESTDSPSRAALVQKAQRIRETGLGKMNRLAKLGGPWPGLVQLYVAATVNLKTPLNKLTTTELLYTAGVLMDAKRYHDAQERLREAAMRGDADAELLGDVLFELGRCQFQLKSERTAAETFAKFAAEHRGHVKAPQAATMAYQLWGKVAEKSRKPEDYLQLAATVRNLVENFADHPNRDEALWTWPVALQLAGRFDEAAQRFAKVPEGSKNGEEAHFRRVICQRRAVEAARDALGSEKYAAQARQAADALREYSAQALQRAESAVKREALLKWSAEAGVAAGELLISPGIAAYDEALKALESFEQQYPESDFLGRALAVRIRAYRGLRQFEQASKMLAQFLQTAAPAQVGGTLAVLARGMKEEVERLLADGQSETARKLAADSVATFEELEKWVRADAGRAQSLEFVVSSRAEMHYLAGQYDAAQSALAPLLEKNAKSGNLQYLNALIAGARLAPAAPSTDVQKVQAAWGALLVDPAIRQRAPERYWEARCNWLALHLRLGNAADVEKAIAQERVWYPDVGGPPWSDKLEQLLRDARRAQGKPPDTQPVETRPGETGSFGTPPAAP